MIGDREKYKKGQRICQKGTYTFAKSVRPLLTFDYSPRIAASGLNRIARKAGK